MADYSNMIGKTYNYWTVVGPSPTPCFVRYKCRCGTERDVNVSLLKSGSSKSCGCIKTKKDGTPYAPRSAVKRVEAGQRYERLTVLEKTDRRLCGRVVWKCLCDCGNVTYVTASRLKNGATKSCGCAGAHTNRMDISGQRFGRLIALEPTDKHLYNSVIWKCRCDCGKTAEVAAINLRNGNTKSCGCLFSEVHSEMAKDLREKLELDYIDGTQVSHLMQPPSAANTSGKTGVSWDKSCQLWKATIIFKGHCYYLGSSKDIAYAISLREEAEKRVHGAFLDWYYETFPDRKRNKKGKGKMTNKQYYFCATEAANYKDMDAYVSDVALSTVWGDAPDATIPPARLENLRSIYTAATRTTKEIVSLSGLSQAAFAERWCIPRRTVEDWCRGIAKCPLYTRLLMQQGMGIFTPPVE